ncbi:hypothetical protein WR25_25458 [Diploscapter pachys]|uniref:Chaperone protein DnaK n=1 Tax=Diploscapter pachys TaxID=2018661 RepID=A0A2A2JNE8_9BILA|nr:hypothetical protein WR25_25458 [Diploscapter pachys]
MGEPITGAVVAIPAFFQSAQIETTKRAVQMAGLGLKMLVKEPTAAAIAYNEDKKLEDSNIMIFDFGGGTLDINICKIENGKLAIKAVHGDEHLGKILVGGSTRIPAIRNILEMKFGQKKLKFNINPDEAVVLGAAILADAIEKKKQIPLINNATNELTQNMSNLQIGYNANPEEAVAHGAAVISDALEFIIQIMVKMKEEYACSIHLPAQSK